MACNRAQQELDRIHADVNAAHNLQRRFWTRHADEFRVPARRTTLEDEEVYFLRTLGPRTLGGLDGYGYMAPTGPPTGSRLWVSLTSQR